MANGLVVMLLLCAASIQPLISNDAAQGVGHLQYPQGGKKSLQDAALIQFGFGHPEQSPSNQESSLAEQDNEKWARWGAYINAALALATFVLAIFAVIQAKAAMKAVSTVMDAERAWILVTDVGNPESLYNPSKPGYVPGIAYRMKVFGHTPAKITAMNFRCHIVPRDKSSIPEKPDLPPIPNYKAPRPIGDIPEGRILAPDTTFTISVNLESTSISETEFEELRDRDKFWCSYGFVEYQDVFGRTGKTQVGYVYNIPMGGVITSPDGRGLNPEGFVTRGPPEYNKAT